MNPGSHQRPRTWLQSLHSPCSAVDVRYPRASIIAGTSSSPVSATTIGCPHMRTTVSAAANAIAQVTKMSHTSGQYPNAGGSSARQGHPSQSSSLPRERRVSAAVAAASDRRRQRRQALRGANSDEPPQSTLSAQAEPGSFWKESRRAGRHLPQESSLDPRLDSQTEVRGLASAH